MDLTMLKAFKFEHFSECIMCYWKWLCLRGFVTLYTIIFDQNTIIIMSRSISGRRIQIRLYTKYESTFSFVGFITFMKLLFYFTAKYLEIRYLYLQVFNGLKLSFMTQKIPKIHSFIFVIYPNRFFIFTMLSCVKILEKYLILV